MPMSAPRRIDAAHPTRERRRPTVSVVMPALNEARNLPHVFGALPRDIDEIVLVDGNSIDGTVEVARSLRDDVRVIAQTRKGKGNALACGFAAATGDIIVMIDADCSTDPGEIPRFVSALLHGADFAKGTRFASGGGSGDITHLRMVGNRALNGLVNLTYRTRYTDLCYGYNAFWRHCLPVIGLDAGQDGSEAAWGDGFEVETIINIRVSRAGLRIFEVPSYEQPRRHGASNLRAFSDGLRVLRTVAHEWRRESTAPSAHTHGRDENIRPLVHGHAGDHVIQLRDARQPASVDLPLAGATGAFEVVG